MGDVALELANDLITLLKDNWKQSNGGKKPVFNTKWNIKEVGRGQRKYRHIIVNAGVDNPDIFSLQIRINDVPTWDFYHYTNCTIDMITSESENSINQIAGEVLRILKTNVVPFINNHHYTQLLPQPIVDFQDDFRNIFRKTMTVESQRFNPESS